MNSHEQENHWPSDRLDTLDQLDVTQLPDNLTHIGFDGKRATNNKTGLGNYSRSLIEHLARIYTSSRYYIYTPKVDIELLKLPLFAFSNVSLCFPAKKSVAAIWRSFGIVKQLVKDNIQLFHGLSHEIPFGLKRVKIASVVTIHDLIFLAKPEYYKLIDRLIYSWKSKYACKNADRIIAISEQTKRDIIRFFQIDARKIEVIYQSCDVQFQRIVTESEKSIVKQKYQLPAQFLLSVGTIEPRKNLLLAVRALANTPATVKLVVIGKKTAYALTVKKAIASLGLSERVIFLSDVPFHDLPAIYQLASIFLYPSRYEGFGIPIIEALYGGVPVIAATGSCLEEAGGPDSLYVSPDNPLELSNAINYLLTDEKQRQKMISGGLNYVKRFDATEITKQMMTCYLKTLSQ